MRRLPAVALLAPALLLPACGHADETRRVIVVGRAVSAPGVAPAVVAEAREPSLPTPTAAPSTPTTAATAPVRTVTTWQRRAVRPQPPAAPSTGTTVFDTLARCESGGNWGASTGNGYHGGLQFTIGSWLAAGGVGLPELASRTTQIAVAQRLLRMQGWGAWPGCSRALHLR